MKRTSDILLNGDRTNDIDDGPRRIRIPESVQKANRRALASIGIISPPAHPLTPKQKARLVEHIRKLQYNADRAWDRVTEARDSFQKHERLLREARQRLDGAGGGT